MADFVSARGAAASRLIIPAAGVLLLALLALLYAVDRPVYLAVLTALMCKPFAHPFIDWEWIPSAAECWARGVDVYRENTCYTTIPHLRNAYSPLWLLASFLPTGVPAAMWMGLALDTAFFASLALLPAPRGRIGLGVIALATFSSMPAFALERCNIDVVMFMLIAAAGFCWLRALPVRFAGYGMIALAGLLKFYPFVLLLLLLREPILRFIALCAAAAAVLAGFVWYFHAALKEMSGNLPPVPYLTDGFGALQFPGGVRVALQWMLQQAGVQTDFVRTLPDNGFFALYVYTALLLLTVGFAIRLVARADFRAALAALAPDQRAFLVIGATLLASCFFVIDNVSYRGIHFLFVLPGLVALATVQAPDFCRTLFRVTAALILFVMWGLSLQQLVALLSGGTAYPMGGSAAVFLYWTVNQLAWWWIVAVLIAVVFDFIGQSTVWRWLGSLLARPPGPRPAN